MLIVAFYLLVFSNRAYVSLLTLELVLKENFDMRIKNGYPKRRKSL